MNIKVIFPKDCDVEEAEETLFKALSIKQQRQTEERFVDPAVEDLVKSLRELHFNMTNEMLTEINALLDSELE